jgi:hypothetical protein
MSLMAELCYRGRSRELYRDDADVVGLPLR